MERRRADRRAAVEAARDGVPRRGGEGRRHPPRHRHHPGVPRGLRRRRLHVGESADHPQGRLRRVHHVRGRQHRPDPDGGQGADHRLRPRPVRPRPDGHAALRRGERRRHPPPPHAAGPVGADAHRQRHRPRGDRHLRRRLPGEAFRGPRVEPAQVTGPPPQRREEDGHRGCRRRRRFGAGPPHRLRLGARRRDAAGSAGRGRGLA